MEKKGFTLIELLVVIAIIGILASIVLVSLSGARDKAKDVRIKASLAQVRSQAEIFYDDHSYTYTAFCADPSIDLLETDIATMGGTLVCSEIPVTFVGYCASSDLSDGTTIVCMDSTGFIGTKTCAAGICPP
jgi:prepilin-type N-terminal cleavage/methylation domain-containing protein